MRHASRHASRHALRQALRHTPVKGRCVVWQVHITHSATRMTLPRLWRRCFSGQLKPMATWRGTQRVTHPACTHVPETEEGPGDVRCT